MMGSYLCVLAVAFLGAVVQTTTGFGFGIVVMAILPFFLPYTPALVVSSTLSFVQATVVCLRYRKHISFKLMLLPLCVYFVVFAVCTRLLTMTPADSMRQALGVILVVLSLYFLFFQKRIKLRANRVVGMAAGGVSGVLSGFFGMGGPPMVLYLMAATEDTLVYMATIQFQFASTGAYNLVVRALNGMITPDLFGYIGLGLVGLAGGIALGTVIFRHLSARNLKLCVYIFMIVVGIWFALGN